MEIDRGEVPIHKTDQFWLKCQSSMRIWHLFHFSPSVSGTSEYRTWMLWFPVLLCCCCFVFLFPMRKRNYCCFLQSIAKNLVKISLDLMGPVQLTSSLIVHTHPNFSLGKNSHFKTSACSQYRSQNCFFLKSSTSLSCYIYPVMYFTAGTLPFRMMG